MEIGAFLYFSNGGRGDFLRAQRKFSNINIDSYDHFFMGAKGGDAWK